MNKKLTIILLILILLMQLSGCGSPLIINDLGTPQMTFFLDDYNSCCSCDIIEFNNEIFIGGGDYDKNSGPVNILKYNLNDNKWTNSGIIYDEEISRFVILDNQLYTCGIDPKENLTQNKGFYKYQNGFWKEIHISNQVIHNFDLITYENKIFAGLGVDNGINPVAYSTDNGESFVFVDFYKNKQLLDFNDNYVSIRVYDFFLFDNNLYCDLALRKEDEFKFEIYKFENNSFVFQNIFNFKTKSVTNFWINNKCEFNGNYYIASGYLLKTNDFNNFEDITFSNENVISVKVFNNKLYVLCGKAHKNKFITTLYSLNDESFIEEFNFEYYVPPLNFCISNNNFYISMGYKNKATTYNGTILKLTK